MTTVTFHSVGGRIDGFQAHGHSGYAEEGSDIVCAAVSAAVGVVECTINEVLGLGASVKIRQRDASITLKIPQGFSEANEYMCENLLTGLMVYLQSMAEDYPDNLIVLMDDEDDGEDDSSRDP